MLVSEKRPFREAETRFFELIKEYPNLRKIPNKEKIELMQLWPRIRYVNYNDGIKLKGERKCFCERMNHLVPHHKSSTPRIIYKNVNGNKITCLRCNHNWKPIKEVVRICPKCKSELWNQSKK